MGWLTDLLDPGARYDDAQEQLDKYYKQGRAAETPFWQRGVDQGEALSGAASALMDPSKLRQQWMKDYTESPEAKMMQQQSVGHGLDTASSMGLMGSSPALQAIQGEEGKIGMADKQQYLQDLMNKYTSGIGVAQNLYGTGAHAGDVMAQLAQHMGTSSGDMAAGAAGARQDMFGRIVKGGLGALVGGPAGAFAGAFGGGTPGMSPGTMFSDPGAGQGISYGPAGSVGSGNMMASASKYLPMILAAL